MFFFRTYDRLPLPVDEAILSWPAGPAIPVSLTAGSPGGTAGRPVGFLYLRAAAADKA